MSLDDLAREAAAHWGGTPVRLIAHRENAVFEMALPQGRAALRLHRAGYQDDAAITSELWWCAALAAAGVAVPAAIAAPGGYLVRLAGGRRASAVTWVGGQALGHVTGGLNVPQDAAPGLHHRLGTLLRDLHDATDRLELPPGFVRPAWDIAGLVGDTPFWGRFWEHPLASAAQRETLIAARGFLDGALTRHQAEGGSYGPIHADVLPENVLVDGAHLSLIDFDDSGLGFRLYDLGTALLHALNQPAYPVLRDALMAGYGCADAAIIDAFALARACASVGWIMPRLAADHPVHRSHLSRACTLARRLLDQT
ncbi:MAG: phosphotransferase enzyme family protein [Paracoccaceae bacterium]